MWDAGKFAQNANKFVENVGKFPKNASNFLDKKKIEQNEQLSCETHYLSIFVVFSLFPYMSLVHSKKCIHQTLFY